MENKNYNLGLMFVGLIVVACIAVYVILPTTALLGPTVKDVSSEIINAYRSPEPQQVVSSPSETTPACKLWSIWGVDGGALSVRIGDTECVYGIVSKIEFVRNQKYEIDNCRVDETGIERCNYIPVQTATGPVYHVYMGDSLVAYTDKYMRQYEGKCLMIYGETEKRKDDQAILRVSSFSPCP